MRASVTMLVVVATIALGGCSQTTSPTSPSSAAPGASATAVSTTAEQSGTMAPPSASKPTTTTLLLVCDSAANAQVDVRLFDGLFTQNYLASVHLECGPDSFSGSRRDTVKVATIPAVGWAIIDVFAVQVGGFIGGCPGGTAVPGSVECPGGGTKKSPAPGATLTIK